MTYRPVLLILALLSGFLFCSHMPALGAEDNLKKVSLLPHWIPQAQFAGYMVASEKGFYREHGLDLTLIPGGPGKDSLMSLASGQTTFAVGWLADAIKKRSAGIELVNLAQIIQRSALLLVAKKKSHIHTPKDLTSKRVGIWVGDFFVPFMAFFNGQGLSPKITPNYTSVNIFLKGAVDAVAAMWYNEYHLILNSGFDPDELTCFRLSDYGINFPEDGLYCMQETFVADPELCARFVQASLKGWLYAFDHKDEAIDIVMKYAEAAHTGTNRAHQQWMLDRMKDVILGEAESRTLGRLYQEDYAAVGKMLKKCHLVDRLPPITEFYRGRQ